MGETVNLHGRQDGRGREFVTDCARYAEGLLNEGDLRAKYRLAERD